MTQCNSFDAKHVRTQVKSIVSISHFHTPRRVPGTDGNRVLGKGRNSFALEISNLEDRGGFFFSCLHFLVRREKENYPAVNR